MKKLILPILVCGLLLAMPSYAASKPSGVKVTKIKSNAATVKWDYNSNNYQYIIKVRKKNGKLVTTEKTTSTSVMVTGLKKSKNYKVSVKAKDYYGYSSKRSAFKTFKTKSWRNYHNTKYGFSLDFPKEWKGFRKEIQTGYDGTYINFGLKSQVMNEWYTLFTLLVYDDAYADDLYALYGEPLAQNDDYVFYWMHAQDTASDLTARAQEIVNILLTMKVD